MAWEDSGWVALDETWELPKKARKRAVEVLGEAAIPSLTRICREYLWRKERGATRQKQAADKQQLQGIMKAAQALAAALDQADPSALDRLEGLLLEKYPDPIATDLVVDGDLSRSLDQIKKQLATIAEAIAGSPFAEKKRGTVKDTHKSEVDRFLAWRLVLLFFKRKGRFPKFTESGGNATELTPLVNELQYPDAIGCGSLSGLIRDAITQFREDLIKGAIEHAKEAAKQAELAIKLAEADAKQGRPILNELVDAIKQVKAAIKASEETVEAVSRLTRRNHYRI